MEIPEHIERRRQRRCEIGDTLRSPTAAQRGRHASSTTPRRPCSRPCTVPARVEPSPRRTRPRRARRRGRGGEAEARRGRGGRRRRGRRRRARARGASPCASSVGASAPRRSTCSSPGSATRAASTSATGTTSAGWSSTSSRAGTAARSRSKFTGQLAEMRLGDARRRAAEARDVHERLRPLDRRPRRASSRSPPEALLVVHDEVDLEPGPPAGPARRRARRPQRAALDRAGARHAGLPAAARSASAGPGAATRARVADYVLSEFEPEDDADALVARAADAVESLARDGLEETQRRFN